MHQEENQMIFTSLMSYDSYCQFTGFRFSVSVCLVPRPLRTLCLSMKSWQLRSGRSGTRKRRRRRPATRDCWRSARQSSRNGALVCGTQVISLLQPIKVSIKLANPYFNKLLINAKFNLISKSAALLGVASFSFFLNVLYSLIHWIWSTYTLYLEDSTLHIWFCL